MRTWADVFKAIIIFGVCYHLGYNIIDLFYADGGNMAACRVFSEMVLLLYLSIGGDQDGRGNKNQTPDHEGSPQNLRFV